MASYLFKTAEVCSLGKLGLFVNESDDIHGTNSNHVQNLLIVNKLYILPVDILMVVLFLFQLKNVLHKKLLQVLVGIVDAELLEALTKSNS